MDEPSGLVLVTETPSPTAMALPYGPRPWGRRLVESSPNGHRKVTTFVVALRVGDLVAPRTCDTAVNGDLFLADVERVRRPQLRPGGVVMMDNLSRH